jgi:hypothetical protein
MKEVWKKIEDYPDYEVSNLGKVKSLKRSYKILLKPKVNKHGYYIVRLYKDDKSPNKKVHQLVAIAFLNHKPCGYTLVVNHKNFNRLDNNVCNLEIVTARENANKKHLKSSSSYVGVYWNKEARKWKARIKINGKEVYLGAFVNELDAAMAYEKKLKEILES